MAADAVLPSLDAGTADLYRKVNCPHPDFTFERLVDGLVTFSECYPGKLWDEVMLVSELNDTPQALVDISNVLQNIRPAAVHINLPTRPPVETWVLPSNQESLMRAMAILGNIAEVVHPAEGSFDLSGYDNTIDAVIAIISRHPVNQALEELTTGGRAQIVERQGVRFWSAAPA